MLQAVLSGWALVITIESMGAVTIKSTLLIAAFGSLGVISRYFIGSFTGKFNLNYPAGTFAINLLGSFLIGFLAVMGTEKGIISRELRDCLGIGFLGGFTTFSAFSLESVRLLETNMTSHFYIYAISSPILGICAAWAGLYLGRSF